ncbi:unnamed protein product [Amoebophrya sp. A120]|nr:unnamed protein product [Amoebophrya sp. A120]|eukprot:GSA120T00015929001.1
MMQRKSKGAARAAGPSGKGQALAISLCDGWGYLKHPMNLAKLSRRAFLQCRKVATHASTALAYARPCREGQTGYTLGHLAGALVQMVEVIAAQDQDGTQRPRATARERRGRVACMLLRIPERTRAVYFGD